MVTKRAEDTQGATGYAAIGYDDTEAMAGARYGGKVGSGHYRVYGKYDRHDAGQVVGSDFGPNDGLLPIGDEGQDDWQRGQLGARMDYSLGGGRELTVQGDGYVGRFGQTRVVSAAPGDPPTAEADEIAAFGANLLGRYHHTAGAGELELQGFYDLASREDGALMERRHTADVEAQYSYRIGTGRVHTVTGGASYRLAVDDTESTSAFLLDPAGRTTHVFGGFLQGEVEVVDERLWLTAGNKLEHNPYTGLELQPGVRLLVRPAARVALWSAITRAVRVPSRANIDGAIEVAPGTVVPIGNPELGVEKMWAYEAGGRWVRHDLSFDAAGFYQRYRGLIDDGSNSGRVDSVGGELAVAWQVVPELLVRGRYAHVYARGKNRENGVLVDDDTQFTNSPRHNAGVGAVLRLGEAWEVSGNGYCLAGQATLNNGNQLPDYLRLDARVRWRASDQLSLDLVGQNLTDGVHVEQSEQVRLNTGVERSVFLRARARY